MQARSHGMLFYRQWTLIDDLSFFQQDLNNKRKEQKPSVSDKKMQRLSQRQTLGSKVIRWLTSMSVRAHKACRSTSCARSKPKKWRQTRREENRKYSRLDRIGGLRPRYQRHRRFPNQLSRASATTNRMSSRCPSLSIRSASSWTRMPRHRTRCWTKLVVMNR